MALTPLGGQIIALPPAATVSLPRLPSLPYLTRTVTTHSDVLHRLPTATRSLEQSRTAEASAAAARQVLVAQGRTGSTLRVLGRRRCRRSQIRSGRIGSDVCCQRITCQRSTRRARKQSYGALQVAEYKMSQSPRETDVEQQAPSPDADEQQSLTNRHGEMADTGLGFDFEVKEQDRWLPIANGKFPNLCCCCPPRGDACSKIYGWSHLALSVAAAPLL